MRYTTTVCWQTSNSHSGIAFYQRSLFTCLTKETIDWLAIPGLSYNTTVDFIHFVLTSRHQSVALARPEEYDLFWFPKVPTTRRRIQLWYWPPFPLPDIDSSLQRFLWSHINPSTGHQRCGGLPISGSEHGGQYRSGLRLLCCCCCCCW
jgi:hypothetical protein